MPVEGIKRLKDSLYNQCQVRDSVQAPSHPSTRPYVMITRSIPSLDYHLPPQDGWWTCSTGLSPCFPAQVLNQTKGFCVLVQLLPKIIYHSDKQVLQWFEAGTHRRDKRGTISAIPITTLLGTGLAGAGTGIASLAIQNSRSHSLRAAIGLDIERIETSISSPQDSLTSLSEVVLQNRRGLDLIFLKQGGLCAALNEECFFFTDCSGIV